MVLRDIPDKATFLEWFRKYYPEVNAENIYTHTVVRAIHGNIESAVDTFLARRGISAGRFQVMMMLEFSDKGMKPSEIANTIGVTQATVTGLLDGLETKEYVRRMDCQDDRRACIVAITEKGKKFMEQARPDFNRWIEACYSSVNVPEKDQLVALLLKVQEAFRANLDPMARFS